MGERATAGTTNEGLVDGPAGQAWFAQPSGLAAAGERLWLADSETSALRYVDKNADGAPGIGAVPMNVSEGVRWNTGLAYVVPALGSIG